MRRVYRGAFAAPVLAAELSGLSPQDRSFVTDLSYGTLRYERFLDAALAPYLKRPDKLPEDVRIMLRLGSYDLLVRRTPRRAVVNEWVQLCKRRHGRLAGLVNAVLRKVDVPDATPAERASVPDWLFARWRDLFGERAEEVAAGMLEPAPLWLRSYHPDAAQALIEEGCVVTPGPTEKTLAVRPAGPLTQLTAFKRGWVQPQNPASGLPASLLQPLADERVLDLASGNGVKAAQLAAGGARVTAVELDAGKVSRAEGNLARLGLSALHLVHDLRTVPDLAPAPKVLLDAPCSGTGTLRAHPEIKRRLTPANVTALADLQKDMLETAAALTEPGGTLVYAVCALSAEESAGVIAPFLETHPDFEPEPFTLTLPHQHTEEGTFVLPIAGMDGFFISRLLRKSSD